MMKLIKNLNIGIKIMGSFALGMLFILIIGVFSIIRLNTINNTVNFMASHLAVDQQRADSISYLLLQSRLYAVHYLINGNPDDLADYHTSFNQLESQLQKIITDNEAHSTDMEAFSELETGITDYNKTFERVVALMRLQNETVTRTLEAESPIMERNIARLREVMAESGDTSQLNAFGDVMMHWLMLTRSTARYLDTENPQYFDDAQEHFSQMNDAFEAMQPFLTADDEQTLAAAAQSAAKAYFQGVQNIRETVEEKEGLIARLNQKGPALLQYARTIADGKHTEFDNEAASARRVTTQTTQIVVLLLVLMMILSVVIGWTTTKGMVKSIAYIGRGLNLLASGNLDVDVSKLSVQQNEFGELSRTLENFVASTRETVTVAQRISNGDLTVSFTPRSEEDALGKALQVMLETLRRQTAELMDGVAILSSSASQLMSTSSEMSATASETASAITETTATVAELRQTAEVTTDRADAVASASQQNAEISQNGLQAMEKTLADMDAIGDHIETIADSIIHLSEQGQTIGNIISAVEDLAEQSNLLAVNAAIEAAKAGEQGKGFAVVAQEIKSLAEQSKQFTVQVQSILNDVQKATGKAVMTTEEGAKRVEKGKQQSAEMGKAIRLLAEHVNRAAQATMQISASSREQLIGVEQVSTAMENIKEASEQNVEGARQLELSAQELERLAVRIQKMFTRYRL